HQRSFSAVAGSASAQVLSDSAMRNDTDGNGNNGSDDSQPGGGGDSDLPSQRASYHDQTVPQADGITAHHHSHADLLGLNNLRNIATGGGGSHGAETATQVKDHMSLVFGDSALPRVVMSQGWMAYGPLTAPLPTVSVGHLNMLGPNSGSPVATTSSSLSGLDLSGLAMGGGSRSGGATASIPVGMTSAGLLLDGLGMSPQDPSYHISQAPDEDHHHQQ
ncbi:hypothetical protein GGF42_008307, partial [Coemansia sp. RSA 2424]